MKQRVVHNYYLDCPYQYWTGSNYSLIYSKPFRTKDTKLVSCKWCKKQVKRKIDYTKQDKNGRFTPILKIKNKRLRATYYYDGSGEVEVLDRGYQVYCDESGRAQDQLEDLGKQIALLQEGYDILKKNLSMVKFVEVDEE